MRINIKEKNSSKKERIKRSNMEEKGSNKKERKKETRRVRNKKKKIM